MARIRPVTPNPTELLAAAQERVTLPAGVEVKLTYDEEADTLYVRLSELRATRSKTVLEEGLVFDYYGNQIVGIEVLDALGKYG